MDASVKDEWVLQTSLIYERVNYMMTGEKTRVISRKTPEKSRNYEFLSKFVSNALRLDIMPHMYFAAQYDESGKKVIKTSPECKLVNKKSNLYYYGQLVLHRIPVEKTLVECLEKTIENIRFMIRSYDHEKDYNDYPDMIKIRYCDRLDTEFVHMVKAGLVHPVFFYADDRLLSNQRLIRILPTMYLADNKKQLDITLDKKVAKASKQKELDDFFDVIRKNYLPVSGESIEEYINFDVASTFS